MIEIWTEEIEKKIIQIFDLLSPQSKVIVFFSFYSNSDYLNLIRFETSSNLKGINNMSRFYFELRVKVNRLKIKTTFEYETTSNNDNS